MGLSMTERRGARILALATEAWGGRGGIAQSTRDLLATLGEMPQVSGIDILPRFQQEPLQKLPTGISQYPARSGKLVYARRALWLSAVQRPDIVYCGHAFMAPLAHLAARAAGARLVLHVHGLEVWEPLSRSIQRGLVASDLVLCVSRHTAGAVAKAAGADPDRCAVIYNTVDNRFVPGDRVTARARFGLTPEALVLSTVSRLDPSQLHKGHDRVIPLLAELARDLPGLTYLIAGTGGDRERLEALACETGAADRVRFLGFVSDADLPDLYRATDLYVMPSHGEGFGIAFVEAMACGTPALGLNMGGANDALRDGELGRAVSETEFIDALKAELAAPPTDRADLADRTRATFGRLRFKTRLAAAMAPVLQ